MLDILPTVLVKRKRIITLSYKSCFSLIDHFEDSSSEIKICRYIYFQNVNILFTLVYFLCMDIHQCWRAGSGSF